MAGRYKVEHCDTAGVWHKSHRGYFVTYTAALRKRDAVGAYGRILADHIGNGVWEEVVYNAHPDATIPAAIRLAEHEHGEAMARLASARARLAQAQEWLDAAERIERGCRKRLHEARLSHGLDQAGQPLLDLA